MIIHIKMDIKHNYAIVKYYQSYIAIITLVIKQRRKKRKKKVIDILHHFLPQAYLIMYPELDLRMCEITGRIIPVP